MRSSNWFRTKAAGSLIVTCVLVAAVTVSSAQDNYLDLLDAYSDDVKTDDGSPEGTEKTQRGAFESQLRQNFKGSYVLYTKLSDGSKDQVFAKYQETGKVADVRTLIVKLYANR